MLGTSTHHFRKMALEAEAMAQEATSPNLRRRYLQAAAHWNGRALGIDKRTYEPLQAATRRAAASSFSAAAIRDAQRPRA